MNYRLDNLLEVDAKLARRARPVVTKQFSRLFDVYCNLVPRGRDEIGTSGLVALVAAVTLSTHAQQPSLNLNAQSNRNQDFLVPVFDFVQTVERSVTADQKCAGSGDEIVSTV